MAEDPLVNWHPRGVDFSRPSPARMYDYALGGKDNYEVDRRAVEQAWQTMPDGPQTARNNRGFLVRAVRLMAEAGIDQFIDIGTGIPTSPSVHEVAREVNPAARVVYVDNDPVVLAHDRALLATDDNLTVIEADMRQPEAITGHPETRALIDFTRPVGLLLVAVLHFVSAAEAAAAMAQLRQDLPRGSMLVLSCGSHENVEDAAAGSVEASYRGNRATAGLTLHSRDEISGLFGDWEMYEPGLCDVAAWHADEPRTTVTVLGGLAYKE